MLVMKNEHRPLKSSLPLLTRVKWYWKRNTFSTLQFGLLALFLSFASFVSPRCCFIALVGRLASLCGSFLSLYGHFASFCCPSVFVPFNLSIPLMADRIMQTVCCHRAEWSICFDCLAYLPFVQKQDCSRQDMHSSEWVDFHSNTGQLFL